MVRDSVDLEDGYLYQSPVPEVTGKDEGFADAQVFDRCLSELFVSLFLFF